MSDVYLCQAGQEIGLLSLSQGPRHFACLPTDVLSKYVIVTIYLSYGKKTSFSRPKMLFCFLPSLLFSLPLILSLTFPLISWLNLRLLWVQAQNQFQGGQQGSLARPEPEQSGLLIIMQATLLPYWDIRDLDITSVLCTVWEPITRFEMWRSGSYCSIENQNTFIHMIQTLFLSPRNGCWSNIFHSNKK